MKRPGAARLEPGLSLGGLSRKRALEWSLVLTARGVEHSLERNWRGYYLKLEAGAYDLAQQEIAAYLKENRVQSFALKPGDPLRNFASTLWTLGGLSVLFSMLGSRARTLGFPVDWQALGMGDAAAILNGQYWRLCTALTLHADPAHLFSNLGVGAVLMLYVCSQTGGGAGWLLVLLSGIAGNFCKVWFEGSGPHFLGASTAVFGAVGLLGGMRCVLHATGFTPRRFLPLAAALMFLAFMGSGDEGSGNARIDLAGHFFGFCAGSLLGLGAGLYLKRFGPPKAWLNLGLGLLAWLILILSWAVALSFA